MRELILKYLESMLPSGLHPSVREGHLSHINSLSDQDLLDHLLSEERLAAEEYRNL